MTPRGRVQIGDRRIEATAPPFVIAEAGVNHDGDICRAEALVDAAADAGADAVKFQIFTADEIATADAPRAEYQRQDDGSQREMLRRLELPREAFAGLRDRAAARCMLFLATPFSARDLDTLLRLEPPAIKIASTDLNNPLLLRAAAASERSLVLSTGAATIDEIDRAMQWMRAWGCAHRVVLLHCVSAYPTPVASANLGAIRALAARFGVPTGFSDHTESVDTGAWAVLAGACVLEKHLTLNRAAAGPDHALSLEPESFSRYVRLAQDAFAARGRGELGFQPIEQDVRRVARRRLVAARDLQAGDALAMEMLAAKRPGDGVSPDQLDRVIGRRLKVALRRDEPLALELLE